MIRLSPIFFLFLLGCSGSSDQAADSCICGDGSRRFCRICGHFEFDCPRIKRIDSNTNIVCKPCAYKFARRFNYLRFVRSEQSQGLKGGI